MCDPLTIAGVALSAGASAFGANSQAKQQERAAEARRRVQEAHRQRLEELQRQSAAQMAGATDAVNRTTDPREQEKAAEQRTADLTAVNAAPAVSAAPVSGSKSSAPQIVQSELGRKVAEAGRRNTERAANTGALGAYSDQFGGQAQAASGAARGIATNSDFAGGWERVLPVEIQSAMSAASQKGATGRMIADIVGAIGGGMTQAGAQGIGPGFGSLFGAAGPAGMYAGGTGTNAMTGLRFGGV